jgi:hypothetical protein
VSQFKYYCDMCDFGIFNQKQFERHCQTKKHRLRALSTSHSTMGFSNIVANQFH